MLEAEMLLVAAGRMPSIENLGLENSKIIVNPRGTIKVKDYCETDAPDGWQIYEAESSDLAGEVLRDLYKRENIAPDQVVLHSDNGSPMALGHPVKGATMLATLQGLGVMPSFSRPA